MNTNTHLLPQTTDPSPWESALYAFLAEKHRRTGSVRTVQSYSRILRCFFVRMQKTPDQVTSAEVMGFCFGKGLSGREPAAITIGSRIATISSFFRFLIRMQMLTSKRCDALERPKHNAAPARGLGADDVKTLLAVIPDTVAGRRDRAIVLTLVLTGRRRSEVLNLTAKDIDIQEERAFYCYRGKGGKQDRRELPRPAIDAIRLTLTDAGKCLSTMTPDESLWRISQPTAYARFRRYLVIAGLPPKGFDVLRHSAAKLRRDAGERVESVSQFLDHSSLAVTTVYLRRLEVAEDTSWGKVAEAIGV
jgi:site-specific recombinase XerD